MRMRYLGWAGLEIEHEGQTLLVDCIKGSFPLIPSEQTRAPFSRGNAVAALVTHLHSDHADPVTLKTALMHRAPVLRPEKSPGTNDDRKLTEQAEAQFEALDLKTELVRPWQERRVGPFHIVAAPAVDGFGDPQLSWIVEAGGTRVLHAGDTLFHGYWWALARAVGKIDVAFLPINGPMVKLPFVQPPSPLPAVMLPEEAAVAAQILRARIAVPIHHGLNAPPEYVESSQAVERFAGKIKELGLTALLPTSGEWHSL